jgi:hypothetical protein
MVVSNFRLDCFHYHRTFGSTPALDIALHTILFNKQVQQLAITFTGKGKAIPPQA